MSKLRANQLTDKASTGAPTAPNGLVVTGVTTSTSFSGSGANLTSLPAGQLTGALPAISGANLTGISAGLFSSYAIITHEKSNNTHGSTLSNSSYATRELNTEVADPDNIVSVSGNQFTLQAGSYLIESMSIIHRGNQSQSRLYNVSDSSVQGIVQPDRFIFWDNGDIYYPPQPIWLHKVPSITTETEIDDFKDGINVYSNPALDHIMVDIISGQYENILITKAYNYIILIFFQNQTLL